MESKRVTSRNECSVTGNKMNTWLDEWINTVKHHLLHIPRMLHSVLDGIPAFCQGSLWQNGEKSEFTHIQTLDLALIHSVYETLYKSLNSLTTISNIKHLGQDNP